MSTYFFLCEYSRVNKLVMTYHQVCFWSVWSFIVNMTFLFLIMCGFDFDMLFLGMARYGKFVCGSWCCAVVSVWLSFKIAFKFVVYSSYFQFNLAFTRLLIYVCSLEVAGCGGSSLWNNGLSFVLMCELVFWCGVGHWRWVEVPASSCFDRF